MRQESNSDKLRDDPQRFWRIIHGQHMSKKPVRCESAAISIEG